MSDNSRALNLVSVFDARATGAFVFEVGPGAAAPGAATVDALMSTIEEAASAIPGFVETDPSTTRGLEVILSRMNGQPGVNGGWYQLRAARARIGDFSSLHFELKLAGTRSTIDAGAETAATIDRSVIKYAEFKYSIKELPQLDAGQSMGHLTAIYADDPMAGMSSRVPDAMQRVWSYRVVLHLDATTTEGAACLDRNAIDLLEGFLDKDARQLSPFKEILSEVDALPEVGGKVPQWDASTFTHAQGSFTPDQRAALDFIEQRFLVAYREPTIPKPPANAPATILP